MKTYLVFTEQCDDDTIITRMTSKKIREYIDKNGYEGIAIVEGNLLKDFTSKVDISKFKE